MSAIPESRIDEIREKVRGERALIFDLNSRISADLKEILKFSSCWLSDAEGFLAHEVLHHPPRSAIEWERWLSFVEGIINRAIAQRKWVEALMEKYGKDARFVGGNKMT